MRRTNPAPRDRSDYAYLDALAYAIIIVRARAGLQVVARRRAVMILNRVGKRTRARERAWLFSPLWLMPRLLSFFRVAAAAILRTCLARYVAASRWAFIFSVSCLLSGHACISRGTF